MARAGSLRGTTVGAAQSNAPSGRVGRFTPELRVSELGLFGINAVDVRGT